MFENLIQNNERKEQEKAEQRAMSFQRERDSFQTNAAEDHTEIMNQQGKSDLIKWQQDLKDEIISLKWKLLGYDLTDDGWIKKYNAMCNETFINQIIDPTFSAYTSRGFINTNLDERQLLMRLKKTCNNLAKCLITKYDEYDIDFKHFDDIDSEVKNILVPAAFRALKGWTKKTDSTIFKRIESSNDGGDINEKKANVFGFAK